MIGLDFLESLDKGACDRLIYWPWFLISCSICNLVMCHLSLSLLWLCAWPCKIPIWPLVSPLSPWEEVFPGVFSFHGNPRMNTRAAEPFQPTNRPSCRKQSCPAEAILDQQSFLSLQIHKNEQLKQWLSDFFFKGPVSKYVRFWVMSSGCL